MNLSGIKVSFLALYAVFFAAHASDLECFKEGDDGIMEYKCLPNEDLCVYEKLNEEEKKPIGCEETDEAKKAGGCVDQSPALCYCDTNFCNVAHSRTPNAIWIGFLSVFIVIRLSTL